MTFSDEVSKQIVREAIVDAMERISAPHTRMRPRICPGGGMWCALYGDNLQHGLAGFGKTPAEACKDFDKNWERQPAALEKLAGKKE